MSDKLPVNPALKVIESIEIYHTAKWWKVVCIIEGWGKKSLAVYQWIFNNGKWKRKQKMGIKNADEWAKIKEAVEQLLPKV